MNYASIASDARKDIADAGSPVFVRRTVPGVYDPTTGKTSAPTTTDYPGVALIGGYKDFFINGTSIKTGDKRFTLAASGLAVVPTQSDKLVDQAGTAYTIINVEPVGPGGVTILYKVQGRK